MFGIKKRRENIEEKQRNDFFEACIKEIGLLSDLEAIEKSLTQAQKQWAFSYASSLGWKGAAPIWVWRQIYLEAKKKFLDENEIEGKL